jgi:hypothetical protein
MLLEYVWGSTYENASDLPFLRPFALSNVYANHLSQEVSVSMQSEVSEAIITGKTIKL